MSIFRRKDNPISTSESNTDRKTDIPVGEDNNGTVKPPEQLREELSPQIEELGKLKGSFRELIAGFRDTKFSEWAFGIYSAVHSEGYRALLVTNHQKSGCTDPNCKDLPTGRDFSRALRTKFEKENQLVLDRAIVKSQLAKTNPEELGEHEANQEVASDSPDSDEYIKQVGGRVEVDCAEIFAEIYDLETEILSTVRDYTLGSRQQFGMFVDWLQNELALQPQGQRRVFLQVLSKDTVEQGENGILSAALSKHKEEMNLSVIGSFANEIAEFAQENEWQTEYQWLSFASEAAGYTNMADFIRDTKDDWPEPLVEIFSSYSKGEMLGRLDSVFDSLEAVYAASPSGRYRSMKDLKQIEDRLRFEVFTASFGRKSKGRTTKETSVSNEITLENNRPVETAARRMIVSTLARVNEAWELTTDAQSLEKMIMAYVSQYPSEKELAADVRDMIRSLSENPNGRATVPVTDHKIRIGGKWYPLKRYSARSDAGNEIHSKIADRTRIPFVMVKVNGRPPQVVIIDIVDHETYETKYLKRPRIK